MTERRPRRPRDDEPAKRSLRPRAVGDMLPAVGGASFRRFGFVQAAVVSRWGEIVGERFAAVSQPDSIRFPAGRRAEGTLTLVVEGAFGTAIQHVVPAIVERVNRFFGYGAVARVTIRQGTLPRPAPRPSPPSLRPMSGELGESVREVADPELRACLESLARAVAASSGPPVVAGPLASLPVVGRVR